TGHVGVGSACSRASGTQRAVALGASRTLRANTVKLSSGVLDSLTGLVESKHINGFLIVSDSLPTEGKAEYRASNLSLQTIEELQRTLNRVVVKARLQSKGVNPPVVYWAHA